MILNLRDHAAQQVRKARLLDPRDDVLPAIGFQDHCLDLVDLFRAE